MEIQTMWDFAKSTIIAMDSQTIWDIAKTLITAIAGFAGVLYGQHKVARKDAKQNLLDSARAAKEMAYVASLLNRHLEQYINGCVLVAYDDGTKEGRPAGENGCYQATTTPPEFSPDKLDVDWRVLPLDLITAILAIPLSRENIMHKLGHRGFDDPPYEEYFVERQLLFARHVQQVVAIALRLRKAGGIPEEGSTDGEWSRDNGVAQVIENIESIRAEHARRYRESLAMLSAR